MTENEIGKMSDRNKLFFDLFKHITTMDTAAILFFAAIIERAEFDHSGKLTMAIIFGLFVVSLFCSLASMWFIANGVLIDIFLPEGKRLIVQASQALSGILLVLGLALVAYVAWEIHLGQPAKTQTEAPPPRQAYDGEALPPVYNRFGSTDDAPPAPAVDYAFDALVTPRRWASNQQWAEGRCTIGQSGATGCGCAQSQFVE